MGRVWGDGVRRPGSFGSTVRNEATDASDLDFLVEFREKTFDAYMDLKTLLERIFDRPVDLVLPENVKPRSVPSSTRMFATIPRDYRVSLDDILEAIERIQDYTGGMDLERFQADRKTIDAVVALEIWGRPPRTSRPMLSTDPPRTLAEDCRDA